MTVSKKHFFWLSTLTGAAVLGASSLTYFSLGEPAVFSSKTALNQDQMPAESSSNRLSNLQRQIKADTQNADLWFAIGHEYMALGEFDNAALVYHYAERLSETPRADIYAAQATARYYGNQQRMDTQTQQWLQSALALEPDNRAALMLLANDHFLSARYGRAIAAWEQVLDANHRTTDRAAIIRSIHQAERMM